MSAVSIVSRAAWGATPARSKSYVAARDRSAFAVHYDGDQTIRYDTTCGEGCRRKIRGTQSFHMGSRGWADIGYNFWICQHGTVFEGRGWDVLGAHAGPSGNAPAIGVQIHIGGSQEPSTAALAACRALYDTATERFGRKLAQRGHCDYMSTSCPGKPLLAWVRAGMPTNTNESGDDDMPLTDSDIKRIADAVWRRPLPNDPDPDVQASMQHWLWRILVSAKSILARLGGIEQKINALLKGDPK